MPIPDAIAKAFERAVDLYLNQWTPSVDEPVVATFVGKGYTITRVCDLIEIAGYSDEIQPPVLGELWSKVFHDAPHGDLKAKFAHDLSYANAAACLRELVQRRKASGSVVLR